MVNLSCPRTPHFMLNNLSLRLIICCLPITVSVKYNGKKKSQRHKWRKKRNYTATILSVLVISFYCYAHKIGFFRSMGAAVDVVFFPFVKVIFFKKKH